MSTNGHANPEAGYDDEALGAALGEAIGRRGETLADIPPVAGITDRATGAANARQIRYAAVGIAAVGALIAGGLVAWNTLGRDGEERDLFVATQPAPAEATTGRASPPAAPEPILGATDTSGPAPDAPGTARYEPDGAPDTSPAESAVGEASTPAALSTGPVPTWTEVTPEPGPGIVEIGDLTSLGDGRIVARARGDSGDTVVVTRDGTTWTEIPMPDAVFPEYIDVSGSRWVVAGFDAENYETVHRVFFSDDEGATWTEMDIATVTDSMSAPPGCIGRSWVALVMSSGDRLVVLVESYNESDLPARCGAPNKRLRILTSDGSGTEAVATYEGWSSAGGGTSDGFFIVLNTPDGALLLTSADGRSWSESPLDHYGPVNAVRIGATTWYAGVIGGPYRIQRSIGGEAPSTVATFDGVQPGDVLDAGPAGLVATVWQVPAVVVDRLPSERIARDGYELRFNEPEGAVTLWDQNADRAVYEFDFEALRSDAPPESVREYHEESGYWNVVFEDPETGADLVTFTLDDLVPVLSSLAMSLGEPFGFDQWQGWIGWSADGTSWGWQDPADAFGLGADGGWLMVDLAVGDDFLLARVQTLDMASFLSSDPDELPPGPRWFTATAP